MVSAPERMKIGDDETSHDRLSGSQITAMNHDPDAALGFKFAALVFAARGIVDRDDNLLKRREKGFCGNEAVALQGRIAFLEGHDRYTASHFILTVITLEPNTLPIKQPVFVQESELAHLTPLVYFVGSVTAEVVIPCH